MAIFLGPLAAGVGGVGAALGGEGSATSSSSSSSSEISSMTTDVPPRRSSWADFGTKGTAGFGGDLARAFGFGAGADLGGTFSGTGAEAATGSFFLIVTGTSSSSLSSSTSSMTTERPLFGVFTACFAGVSSSSSSSSISSITSFLRPRLSSSSSSICRNAALILLVAFSMSFISATASFGSEFFVTNSRMVCKSALAWLYSLRFSRASARR
mmetsp:Transcript_37124/g.66199  ORF Transcript_37124/g.66199 Transcript_37124/m.66199 type:complete len:212 (-) Transcript_37124:478-1113(-)